MRPLRIWLICFVLIPACIGCADKKITYTATGSVIGAGGGYAINRDVKDAAIGGLLGGITGSVVANSQINSENKKYKEGYDQGYTQSQLEVANNNWNENTGKQKEDVYLKSYERIKIPKKEVNDVLYDSHYETLEVYQ